VGDLQLTENCQKLFNSCSFGNVSAKNQSRNFSEKLNEIISPYLTYFADKLKKNIFEESKPPCLIHRIKPPPEKDKD
jgi:hypothetical protein